MTVHFIGAGPGAPDLITLRARDLLAASPVCLYAGSLVNPDVLAHCPPDARLVDTARLTLDAIVDELVAADRRGLDVARLCSGDPSLFSAVAEQMRRLDRAGVTYDVCPGVPAFSAAAAELGRELTVPGVSQSVVLTRTSENASAMPAGQTLAAFGATGATLVVHLSVQRIEAVVDELVPVYGADTPVAVVAWASRPGSDRVAGDAGRHRRPGAGGRTDPGGGHRRRRRPRGAGVPRQPPVLPRAPPMRVLILGGTGEARDLAAALNRRADIEVISSLAGRVREPALPVGEVVIGGFGGVPGLVEFLHRRRVDALIDATHPFAVRISRNAALAAARAAVPLHTLTRPGWAQGPGDRWTRVPDVAAAAQAVTQLCPPGATVLLTTGRRDLAPFTADEARHYVIRSVDRPEVALPQRHTLLLDRGPYTVTGETTLLRTHGVCLLVTKDSGGSSTAAKLVAARALSLPVVVVDRPPGAPGGCPTVDSLLTALRL